MTVWLDHQGGTVHPDVAARARELVAAGRSDDEIGAEFGVSARTAKRIRTALGLVGRTPARLVSDSMLRTLVDEGLSAQAIAARSGLTLGSTRTRLSRLGLRASSAGPGRPPKSGERRRQVLQVALSAEEHAALVAAAGEEDVTAWARRLLLREAAPVAQAR